MEENEALMHVQYVDAGIYGIYDTMYIRIIQCIIDLDTLDSL